MAQKMKAETALYKKEANALRKDLMFLVLNYAAQIRQCEALSIKGLSPSARDGSLRVLQARKKELADWGK